MTRRDTTLDRSVTLLSKVQLQHTVLRDAAAKMGAKLVMSALLDCFNTMTGRCCPSLGQLADATRLTPRSVTRSIGQLVALGYLAIERRAGRRNHYAPQFSRIGKPCEVDRTPYRGTVEKPAENPERATTAESSHPDTESRVPLTLCQGPIEDSGNTEPRIQSGKCARAREPQPESNDLIRNAGRNFGARSGKGWSDPAVRKARWEQKIIAELYATRDDDEARRVVQGYMEGAAWAVRAFDQVDDAMRDRARYVS